MKKIIILGIMLLFIGMTISSSIGFNLEKQSTVSTLDGNTLYVGGSGPGNYSTIQEAIDDASDGDTVFVYDDSSPYIENVVVNKSITLIGEYRDTTIIEGDWSNDVYISADWVNISSFTIRYNGIRIVSSNNTITNNTILNSGCDGICLDNSNSNTITNNTILKNWCYGIRLDTSINNTINGNTISNNYIGITNDYSYNSTDNIIYHNNFINNTQNAFDKYNNTWDNGYPSGGNYWDDYTGNDSDGDGIGDTPYPIPGGNNEDRYPLMKPWNWSINSPYGPDKGLVDVDYTFCIDLPYNPEGESYIVMWDWGDGYYSDWFGPYGAGETVCANHMWTEPGEYDIRVILRDNYGNTFWSDPWTITIVNITELDIEIQVKFPGKIITIIRNIGNDNAYDVHYSINVTVKGIIFGLGNIYQNGTLDIIHPDGEHIWTISKGMLIGLGWFNIIVTASAFNAEEVSKALNAVVLLFFLKIISGG